MHFIEAILRALEIFNMLNNEDGVQMLLQMNVTFHEATMNLIEFLL